MKIEHIWSQAIKDIRQSFTDLSMTVKDRRQRSNLQLKRLHCSHENVERGMLSPNEHIKLCKDCGAIFAITHKEWESL